MSFDQAKMDEMNRLIARLDHNAVFAFIEGNDLEPKLKARTGYETIAKLREALEQGSTSGHRHDLPHPVAVLMVVVDNSVDYDALSQPERALVDEAREIVKMNHNIIKDMQTTTSPSLVAILYPLEDADKEWLTAEDWVMDPSGKN